MKHLHESIARLLRIGLAGALVFTAIYFIIGSDLMGLLTSDREAVRVAMSYFPWVLAVPLAGFMAFIWDGIFGGMTHTKLGLLVPMIVAVAVFFLVYHLLGPRWGNHGLWAAFVAYCFTRGICQTLYYAVLRKNAHLTKTLRGRTLLYLKYI